MTIDWEAAKSGKRPVRRVDGALCRYLGSLGGCCYAIAVFTGGEHEIAMMYRDNGTCLTGGPHLVQDPEVIEFKRWVNVFDHWTTFHVSRLDAFRDPRDGAIKRGVPLTIRITGDKVEISGGTE